MSRLCTGVNAGLLIKGLQQLYDVVWLPAKYTHTHICKIYCATRVSFCPISVHSVPETENSFLKQSNNFDWMT